MAAFIGNCDIERRPELHKWIFFHREAAEIEQQPAGIMSELEIIKHYAVYVIT
jgi:hypothetical protein